MRSSLDCCDRDCRKLVVAGRLDFVLGSLSSPSLVKLAHLLFDEIADCNARSQHVTATAPPSGEPIARSPR